MFNKKVLAASMAVAMAGGFATTASAMQVANNNVGQLLLAPVYVANGNMSTDITVVNNRTDAAVKAKVVFRSHEKSKELRDFIIYLTPGDVWRGTVALGSDNLAHIQSTDDSMLQSISGTTNVWANQTAVDKEFASARLTTTTDSTTMGHVEVIGVVAAAGSYTVGSSTITVTRGMSKDNLKTIFDAHTSGTVGTETDYTICTPSQIASAGNANAVSAISPCSLQISGEVTVKDSNGRATMMMTALENVSVATTNSEPTDYVITNPAYNATISATSEIGVSFHAGANTNNTDATEEIEAALATASTAWAYESSASEMTDSLVSFVTKYRHESDLVGVCGGGAASATGNYSAPFQDTTIGEMQYAFTSFDNSENVEVSVVTSDVFSGDDAPPPTVLSLNNEVNYVAISTTKNATGPYYFAESGWSYYSWLPRTGCSYTGTPEISYAFKYMPTGQYQAVRTLDKEYN